MEAAMATGAPAALQTPRVLATLCTRVAGTTTFTPKTKKTHCDLRFVFSYRTPTGVCGLLVYEGVFCLLGCPHQATQTNSPNPKYPDGCGLPTTFHPIEIALLMHIQQETETSYVP